VALDQRGIVVTKSTAVATVTISNPAKRNPIGTPQAEAIVAILESLDRDDDVRVVIMTGAGETFSAGGDLDEFLGTIDSGATALWDTGEPWQRLFSIVPTLSKPVIARVIGPALAGGCGLVASCGFVFAADNAIFGTPEIKIGLFPLLILPMLIRRIGERHSLEMVLTGRSLDAAEAMRFGLVNIVVPRDQLDTSVNALASQLATIPLATMARAKYAFRAISTAQFSEAMEIARGIRGAFMGSNELKEGISRFFKKG
jgi:enoyl-CoA hydratase/carnithine racemase